jgi:hypothetical protein
MSTSVTALAEEHGIKEKSDHAAKSCSVGRGFLIPQCIAALV